MGSRVIVGAATTFIVPLPGGRPTPGEAVDSLAHRATFCARHPLLWRSAPTRRAVLKSPGVRRRSGFAYGLTSHRSLHESSRSGLQPSGRGVFEIRSSGNTLDPLTR